MSTGKETLSRFLLRARRVQAHSLVADRKTLSELVNLKLEISLSEDGTVETRQKLPDEERFESLAARLRPLLVESESIHYKKVLGAIDEVLAETTTADIEALSLRVKQLRDFWSLHAEKSLSPVRYTTQATKADGSETTPLASDSQLAMAWLYGDLVHVDVQGKKKAGTFFPMKERFAAAVSYFATIALACLHTFDLVSTLVDHGIIEIDEEAMYLPVVVGTDELITRGTAFIAPTGTDLPDLQAALSDNMPDEFQQLTVSEMTRISRNQRAQIRLETADGDTLVTYGATVAHNHVDEHQQEIHVRVAEIFTWKITFLLAEERKTLQEFQVEVEEPSTNQMFLEKVQIERNLVESARLEFSLPQVGTFSVPLQTTSEENVNVLDVYIDTLQDIVKIEKSTNQELGISNGTLNPKDRAILRISRLLWEGKIVPLTTSPISITIDADKEPEVLGEEAQSSEILNLKIPRPRIFIRHPLMVAKNVQPVVGSEPPQVSMQMVVPVAEPFVAWAPQLRDSVDDADLKYPTEWGLSHFDYSEFFGTTWSIEDGLTENLSD